MWIEICLWEELVADADVSDYFRGRISLFELIQYCDFYDEYKDVLNSANTVQEFKQVVREYNIFNMND